MQIDGSVAFITGAGSGLGAATVLELESAGARLASFDLNFPDQSPATDGLKITGDIRCVDDVRRALAQCQAHFGSPVCLVINCAGLALPGQRLAGPKGPLDLEQFKNVLDVNVSGTFNVMSLAADAMLSAECEPGEERGVIINVSSICAEDGPVGTVPYSCSKAAVTGMTLPAARDLGPFGIRVNCILPGSFDTPMLRSMPREAVEYVVSKNPFPKRPALPAEFAALARHIIENPAVNGVNWRLDSGVRLAFES